MRPRARTTKAAALLGITMSLTACASQIAGLAPVGGDTAFMIRTAAIDVLLAHKLTIRDAPACTDIGDGYSCVGSLTDGATIVVTAPGSEPVTMTVHVGDLVLYDGSIQQVLDDTAQDLR
jgi:hypothetical protein